MSVDVVVGCGFQHCKDEVASTSGDADDGGVVLFAFISLALVVGLGVRVVSRGDECGEEHCVLETVVAASAVE